MHAREIKRTGDARRFCEKSRPMATFKIYDGLFSRRQTNKSSVSRNLRGKAYINLNEVSSAAEISKIGLTFV